MLSWTHRRQVRVPVDIKVTELGGGSATFGQAQDISTTGLYVSLNDFELDGAEVAVEFNLPGDDEAIWALCQVVRDDRVGHCDGHALHFSRLAERDKLRIADYVERYYQPVVKRLYRPVPQAQVSGQRTRFLFRAASELLC